MIAAIASIIFTLSAAPAFAATTSSLSNALHHNLNLAQLLSVPLLAGALIPNGKTGSSTRIYSYKLRGGATLLTRLPPEEFAKLDDGQYHEVELAEDGSGRLIQHATKHAPWNIIYNDLRTINNYFGIDLVDCIIALSRRNQQSAFRVLEWGVGSGSTLAGVVRGLRADNLRKRGIKNVKTKLFGFGETLYPRWHGAPENVIFILDVAECLNLYFKEKELGLIYGYHSLCELRKYGPEELYIAHLRMLNPLICPNGEIWEYPALAYIRENPGRARFIRQTGFVPRFQRDHDRTVCLTKKPATMPKANRGNSGISHGVLGLAFLPSAFAFALPDVKFLSVSQAAPATASWFDLLPIAAIIVVLAFIWLSFEKDTFGRLRKKASSQGWFRDLFDNVSGGIIGGLHELSIKGFINDHYWSRKEAVAAELLLSFTISFLGLILAFSHRPSVTITIAILLVPFAVEATYVLSHIIPAWFMNKFNLQRNIAYASAKQRLIVLGTPFIVHGFFAGKIYS